MNGLLCFLTTAALAAAYFGLTLERRRRTAWILCGIACGLGLLAKGPVILALVIPPALAFSWLDQRAKLIQRMDVAHFLAATLGIAAPWYLWAATDEPGFTGYFFWKHNILRFVEPFDHAKPWWFYLGDCLLATLPWSVLGPILVWQNRGKDIATRPGGEGCPPIDAISPRRGPRRLPAVGFALLSFLWIFAFFSAAGSKRSGYILPAIPLLAVILGSYASSWLTSLRGRNSHLIAWRLSAASTFIVLLAAVQFVLPTYSRRFSMRGQIRPLRLAAADPRVPVICYPRTWDSVRFYLRRKDVVTFTRGQSGDLTAFLRRHPHTLAFVKADSALEDFRRHLPASLEFVPQGRQTGVVAGWIRAR
jgi:4-amino-4-deoxy-L-arabinose transferase-like glycosyltransferase